MFRTREPTDRRVSNSVAGGAGGKLNTGFHYRSTTKENAHGFHVAAGPGLNLDTFGRGPDETSQGLAALEVS